MVSVEVLAPLKSNKLLLLNALPPLTRVTVEPGLVKLLPLTRDVAHLRDGARTEHVIAGVGRVQLIYQTARHRANRSSAADLQDSAGDVGRTAVGIDPGQHLRAAAGLGQAAAAGQRAGIGGVAVVCSNRKGRRARLTLPLPESPPIIALGRLPKARLLLAATLTVLFTKAWP